jgi:Peptidase C39 family/Methyltransferase domain
LKAPTQIPCEDQSIDLVASFETIEHISEHDVFLSEIKRVLAPGGILVISSPHKAEYQKVSEAPNPFHEAELDHDEFVRLITKRFTLRSGEAKIGDRVLDRAASLAMICRHFGRKVSLARIRQLGHTSLDGTSLKGLCHAATELGLAARALKVSPHNLPHMPLPAIVHWEGNHWMVLYDVGDSHVRRHAISPQATEAMLALLDRPLGPPRPTENQVKEFMGEALPARSRLWSKEGDTSEVLHDAVYVELPGGSKLIMVILIRGAAGDKTLLPVIGKHLLAELAP